MGLVWQDDHLTLYGGDCREVLKELPAESVHCVVTSPPYWGLRDYGTATWDGGDPECDHRIGRMNDGHAGDIGERNAEGNAFRNSSRYVDQGEMPKDGNCLRCGARRIDSQLGLEATPEEFVANMVAVFREVRRVLRADGTLWLNLGDSYAQTGGTLRGDEETRDKAVARQAARGTSTGQHGGWESRASRAANTAVAGLKPKDLVGIPWRVAFALQADGWYLRSDIIWAKPNPMPESVTDRPTKAHEYLFLLSKSPRYYYDAEAVREAAEYGRRDGGFRGGGTKYVGQKPGHDNTNGEKAGTVSGGYPESGRNLRSVWTIATEPYPGAHFATFPRKLVEPCVKAGTSERGVCPECGAPWVREFTRDLIVHHEQKRKHDPTGMNAGSAIPTTVGSYDVKTTGWSPSCRHDAEPVPATVLDPFAGSGTTLLVAQSLGRRGIGIDLSPDYLKQALLRNRQTPLGLIG